MQVTPYVFFDGQCAEALAFYNEAVGAEILFSMQYKDSPEPLPEEMNVAGLQDRVMHATFKLGDSHIMTSDAAPGHHKGHGGFSLSITVVDKSEAEKIFNGLSNGGKVLMPLTETFFSPYFGTLQDKFGIEWMVYVEGEQTP